MDAELPEGARHQESWTRPTARGKVILKFRNFKLIWLKLKSTTRWSQERIDLACDGCKGFVDAILTLLELTSADAVLDIAVKICEIGGNLGFPESVCRGSVEAYWVNIRRRVRIGCKCTGRMTLKSRHFSAIVGLDEREHGRVRLGPVLRDPRRR